MTDKQTKIVPIEQGHYEIRSANAPANVLTNVMFQEGPIKEAGVNGIQVEDLLEVCLLRLGFFQTDQGGKHACGNNAIAIGHVAQAIAALEARTKERVARDVEGASQI